MTGTPPSARDRRFLLLYALAAAGGSTSYAPFLTVLLPARVVEIAGADAVRVLSVVALTGAITASAANILFGWLSDRSRNRTGWILAGVALSSTLLVAMHWVETLPQLMVMIVAWQAALNMFLNPLAAWAGDRVPDEQKGTLGGLLSLAPGTGALAGALVTAQAIGGGVQQLVLLAFLVVALVLPVLVWGRPRALPHLMAAPRPRCPEPSRPAPHAAQRMWLARLLVQIAESAMFAFLYMWLRELDRATTANGVATIFTVVLFASVPVAIAAGRWSDRTGRPIRPLTTAAGTAAAGLSIMAATDGVKAGVVGYCIFGVASGVFLALHTSQTLRVLPDPRRRGRDLGVFNLTNTIPSMIMPALTFALIPLFGFKVLFIVLAALLAASAAILATLRLGRNR